MDPDACFQRYLDTESSDERQDACRDLCQWIDRGGFEPQWSSEERRAFFAYSVEPYRYEGSADD